MLRKLSFVLLGVATFVAGVLAINANNGPSSPSGDKKATATEKKPGLSLGGSGKTNDPCYGCEIPSP